MQLGFWKKTEVVAVISFLLENFPFPQGTLQGNMLVCSHTLTMELITASQCLLPAHSSLPRWFSVVCQLAGALDMSLKLILFLLDVNINSE